MVAERPSLGRTVSLPAAQVGIRASLPLLLGARIRTLLALYSPGAPGVLEFPKIMYAVIATGGKQYRVSEGSVLRLEKLEAEAGADVEFDRVLLVGQGDQIKVGAPYLDGGKVIATVQSHGKGDKVRVVKFRRRKHYLRQGNHRQHYTEVKITSIVGA